MIQIFGALLCACAGLLAPATSAADAAAGSAVVTGGGAHFAWVVFEQLKPDLERVSGRHIELHGRNSTLGMGCNAGIKTALRNAPGHETFGFVCCPLSEEEVAEKHLRVYPLALEPVLIVVHKDNPVSNLSSDQVRAIMRGDIVNWREVGGVDEPIVLVARLHCKKRPGHWKTILPDAEAFRQQRLNVSSAADMEQRVGDFKGAIGHIGSTWDFAPDNKLKVVTIDGYQPTPENLRDKHYPFYRSLSAVTDQHPSKDVLTIIKEVQTGPAFDAVARRYGLLKIDSYEPGTEP
ncbi:MAG: substrate-binding domain-containing protein [Thiogranum sp.]